MPNWMYNEVSISGDKDTIEEVKNFLKGTDRVFDFDKIAPMPPELEITAGSDEGKALLAYCEESNLPVPKEAYKQLYIPQDKCEIERYLSESWHEHEAYGRKIYENLIQFGYADWYHWRIAHWGTKWNAIDAVLNESPEELSYAFNTAWSFPFQVIRELSKKFPNVRIDVNFESIESSVRGTYAVQAGKELEFNQEEIEFEE
jgi:hypothetical protein